MLLTTSDEVPMHFNRAFKVGSVTVDCKLF